MPIEFNAREFAVRDRAAWSTTKEQIFGLLKIKSIETVADALRLGKLPPRHLQERYTEPNRTQGRKTRRTWLMASRIARTAEGWEITVEYFGAERDIPFTELTAGDILHSEKVYHEEYSTSWRGHVFVVEAVPAIGTPPSPLHNVDDAFTRAMISAVFYAEALLLLLPPIIVIHLIKNLSGVYAIEISKLIAHSHFDERINKEANVKICAEADFMQDGTRRISDELSVASNTCIETAQRDATTIMVCRTTDALFSSTVQQNQARRSFVVPGRIDGPEIVTASLVVSVHSAAKANISIVDIRGEGARS